MLYIKTPAKYYAIYYVKVILDRLNMPKYAVAVGRKVGIYDTYDECKKQILNFPNARFKKFDSVADAEAFIKKFSKNTFKECVQSFENIPSSVENVNHPELYKVDKISPSNDLFSLTNRVCRIEEKFTKFVSDTTNTLERLVKRLNDLESKVTHNSDNFVVNTEPPRKKIKTVDEGAIGELIKNDKGYVVVYTDGACTNNGKMGAQAGIGIWFNDNHPLNVSAPVQGPATNNNAEIQAARVAVMQGYRAGVKKLNIKTDSKFVINCITAWIHKWKKNDWKLSTGGHVKNKEELLKLDNAIQLLDSVEWDYVAGHRGVRGNEMADKLAREGARQYKTNVTYSNNAELENVKFFDSGDFDSS